MDVAGREAEPAGAGQPIRVRLLVADEISEALERTAEVTRGLGHDVVALEISVEAVTRSVREEAPDLAIVALHSDEEHALELIREIVDEQICPVILLTGRGDAEFAARAAALGTFALSQDLEPDALQGAIEVAVRRFEEHEELAEQIENLEGALRRRALVERAKGMVMERQRIGERAAFELLRDRARSSNRTLVDVARSVLDEPPHGHT